MNQPAHHCAECAVRAHCEFTFGKFYADKSRGGVGCDHPISAFDLDAAKRNSPAVATPETNPLPPPRTDAPEREEFVVTASDGREFVTTAKSEAQAVNNVRFREFANAPLSRCPTFGARRADRRKPTRTDILERIRRMTRS